MNKAMLRRALALEGRLRRDEHQAAVFPFGYGLSYTSFAYTNLQIDRPVAAANEQAAISIAITNCCSFFRSASEKTNNR